MWVGKCWILFNFFSVEWSFIVSDWVMNLVIVGCWFVREWKVGLGICNILYFVSVLVWCVFVSDVYNVNLLNVFFCCNIVVIW